MKILIVEDEALIAMHLELLVEDFGHQVCAVAASKDEAIAHAAVHLPDVVLMDVRLARGSSGIDAAREIHDRHGIRCNASASPVNLPAPDLFVIFDQHRSRLDAMQHPDSWRGSFIFSATRLSGQQR